MKFWAIAGAAFVVAFAAIWVSTSPTIRFSDVDVEEASCKYLGTDTEGVHNFHLAANGTASGPNSVVLSGHAQPIDVPVVLQCTGWGSSCFRNAGEVRETSWRAGFDFGTVKPAYDIELEVQAQATRGQGRDRVYGDRSRQKVNCAVTDPVVAGVE